MEKRSSTAVYAAVNGSYWASFCLVYSFAAVYLQAVGYSNTELGWVLAVGSGGLQQHRTRLGSGRGQQPRGFDRSGAFVSS